MAELSKSDVDRLARNSSPAARAATATKLAQQFGTAKLSRGEMRLAEEIFRIMMHDAEVRVREALSANLRDNPALPHDVAIALAKDVDSVALPMLDASEVLTADDLLEIIASQGTSVRLDAIAGRKRIDARVTDAIVNVATEKLVVRLLANPGAEFAEPTLHKVVDRFGDSESVQEPLVDRAQLPVTVAERLLTTVADRFRSHLLSRHKVSPQVAMELILHSRERATVGLAMGVSEAGLAALAEQLRDNDRLSGSLVVRAICMGNLRFFEHALACLGDIAIGNARMLIHDPGKRGLKTLWSKSGLNTAHLPVIEAALDVVSQTELDGRAYDPERYSRRIIERLLTQDEKLGVAFDRDDLEYLLARVNQLPAESVAIH